jgi:ferredoxin
MSALFSSISNLYAPDGDRGRETGAEDGSKTTFCGQTEEKLELLLRAYQWVAQQHEGSEIVAVHCESGSCKTCLVDVLRETARQPVKTMATSSPGEVLSKSRRNPRTIFRSHDCLLDLCELIHQSDDFDQKRKEIQTTLGSDGWLLSKAVSHLDPPFLTGNPV